MLYQLCVKIMLAKMEQTFQFDDRPFLKENRKSNKSFPFVEMVENMEIYPYISKFSVYLDS